MRVMKEYTIPAEIFDGVIRDSGEFIERADEESKHDLGRKLLDCLEDGEKRVVQMKRHRHKDYRAIRPDITTKITVDIEPHEKEHIFVPYCVEVPSFRLALRNKLREWGHWFFRETNGEFGYDERNDRWVWGR